MYSAPISSSESSCFLQLAGRWKLRIRQSSTDRSYEGKGGKVVQGGVWANEQLDRPAGLALLRAGQPVRAPGKAVRSAGDVAGSAEVPS